MATKCTSEYHMPLLFTGRPEKYITKNLTEAVEYLLHVKFHQIPFSGCGIEVENILANHRQPSYSKNASSVAIFLEVVHCSVDEYLRKILQHLHELHRKGPYFLCCDDKDAMTVTTQKK